MPPRPSQVRLLAVLLLAVLVSGCRGTPSPDMRRFLLTTYAAHVAPPADARDTGFARDGRHLSVAADGSAAYLVGADGDAERWPASRRPFRCA